MNGYLDSTWAAFTSIEKIERDSRMHKATIDKRFIINVDIILFR